MTDSMLPDRYGRASRRSCRGCAPGIANTPRELSQGGDFTADQFGSGDRIVRRHRTDPDHVVGFAHARERLDLS